LLLFLLQDDSEGDDFDPGEGDVDDEDDDDLDDGDDDDGIVTQLLLSFRYCCRTKRCIRYNILFVIWRSGKLENFL